MKIAVCIKRVPDTETRVKIGADGTSIDETGVKFVPNPYDEYAVEEALQLKEKAGGGEVRIHKPNGGPVRDSDTVSPAKDPNPPTDKNIRHNG